MAVTPAELIRQFLVSSGLGVNPSSTPTDWTATFSQMPEQVPDNRITVYDTGAEQDGRLTRGERIEFPTIQIRIRSKDVKSGWDKGKAIQVALDSIKKTVVTVSGTPYTVERALVTTPLMPIGEEEKSRRVLHTINVRLTM